MPFKIYNGYLKQQGHEGQEIEMQGNMNIR